MLCSNFTVVSQHGCKYDKGYLLIIKVPNLAQTLLLLFALLYRLPG